MELHHYFIKRDLIVSGKSRTKPQFSEFFPDIISLSWFHGCNQMRSFVTEFAWIFSVHQAEHTDRPYRERSGWADSRTNNTWICSVTWKLKQIAERLFWWKRLTREVQKEEKQLFRRQLIEEVFPHQLPTTESSFIKGATFPGISLYNIILDALQCV